MPRSDPSTALVLTQAQSLGDWLPWLALGLVCGAGLVMVLARWQVRRSLLRQAHAEKRARAAERLAELGSMTRGLAHEIKNPLSTISLNAQLLSERIDDAPQHEPLSASDRAALHKRVDALRREVERLRGILTDFLTYAGELRLEVQPKDVGEVLRELGDFFAPQALHAGVKLRVETPASGLRAQLDEPHLKQALLNLLLNALHALQGSSQEAKREIVLAARATTLDDSPTQPAVAIDVIDSGPGIAPEVLARIFDPYFTTKAGGSGLGLPTARRIIEGMGGRLHVHTKVGEGTRMTIVLSV
jgi:signal transduction histidine kinase